jgi:hypothetical protein
MNVAEMFQGVDAIRNADMAGTSAQFWLAAYNAR